SHGGGAGRMPVFMRRVMMPGAAVAAVATFSFLMAPAVMQSLQGGGGTVPAQVRVVANAPAAVAAQEALVVASAQVQPEGRIEAQPAMLRDPGLDEYLRAHQRFSPSVYSAAQFARSATFVHDTSK